MPKDRSVKMLKGLKVHEVSVVPDGANDDAQILIRKGKGMDKAGFEPCADCPSPAGCKAKRRCAIETPAKNADRKDMKAVRKGLEAAEAAAEVLIEKAGDSELMGGIAWIEVARAAVEDGIEKAAQTFADVYGVQARMDTLRQGVSALNSSIWSILDDPGARDNAPRLIAKSVMQFGDWIEEEFAGDADDGEVEKTADKADEGEGEPAAGGSGEDAGESGIGKSGDEAMPKTDVDVDQLIAKATKDLSEENAVLKSRLSKLEEKDAEQEVTKAATDMAALAPRLTLPGDALRTVVKQLDADGRKALGNVLSAAGKQAATDSLFTAIGKNGTGDEQDGGTPRRGLIEKAKARREEIEKARGGRA